MSRTQLGVRLSIPAVVIAVIGVGLYTYMSVGAEAPVVSTTAVTRGDIVRSISASGTLEAVTTVDVGTQVSGTVKDLLADFNDIVRVGQVLARLDPSLLQAQVDQAGASLLKAEADAERLRVALEEAQASLDRLTKLSARNLVSAADMDAAASEVRASAAQLKSAQAQVVQARASLDQARVNLGHTIIASPIDAVVIARNVDVGQTVAASMSAPTLYVLAADLTRMRVKASIDESDIASVREGLDVAFNVDAYPGETFMGRVAQVRLQGEVVSNVVTYTTVIDVSNPELKLKPGMTANVTVRVACSENALRVPATALRFKPTDEQLQAFGAAGPVNATGAAAGPVNPARAAAGRSAAAERAAKRATVWRYAGSMLEPVTITTGITDGTMTEVLDGALSVDDRVVTSIASGVANATKAIASPSTGTVRNPLMGGGMGGPPPR